MVTIGRYQFPEQGNQEDSKAWKPAIIFRALHMQVLCVANTRIEGTWSAYCGPVPGMRHRDEFEAVRQSGEKLPHAIARAIFPEFDGIDYSG